MSKRWINCAVINDEVYKFVEDEEEPLKSVMKINRSYNLVRDIDRNTETEKLTLVKFYTTFSFNGKQDTFSRVVYNGKDITKQSFMNQLVEHILELTK